VQTFVKQRATETGDITFNTPAIDVSGMPLLTHELIVYDINGSTPDITVTPQTSSDLQTWKDIGGTALNLTAAGSVIQPSRAATVPYSRYVRYKIVISGTVTSIEYSLVLNQFASS
jgi:hypothetical protein